VNVTPDRMTEQTARDRRARNLTRTTWESKAKREAVGSQSLLRPSFRRPSELVQRLQHTVKLAFQLAIQAVCEPERAGRGGLARSGPVDVPPGRSSTLRDSRGRADRGTTPAVAQLILCSLSRDPHNFLISAIANRRRPHSRSSIVESWRLVQLGDPAPVPIVPSLDPAHAGQSR
jgi:hypothetical protein